jgi:hypothetical protein
MLMLALVASAPTDRDIALAGHAQQDVDVI